jgi:hypothetical protein
VFSILPQQRRTVAVTGTGDTITIGQVKAVAQTVKTVGGSDRLTELLGLVREVGGMKKFKDLLEAMSVGETSKP